MAKIPQYPDEAAFPRDAVKHIGMNEAREISLPTQWGLTKREYIAAQIMSQMAVQDGHVDSNATRAVRAADALLRALSVG